MPLKQRLAAYYRAAAARGRRLLAEATTPWLKEHLGAEIARHEQLAEEIDRASEPGVGAVSTQDEPPNFKRNPRPIIRGSAEIPFWRPATPGPVEANLLNWLNAAVRETGCAMALFDDIVNGGNLWAGLAVGAGAPRCSGQARSRSRDSDCPKLDRTKSCGSSPLLRNRWFG